jgi:hypothetical protein
MMCIEAPLERLSSCRYPYPPRALRELGTVVAPYSICMFGGKIRRGTCIVKVSVIYQLNFVTWCSKNKFVVSEGRKNGNDIKAWNT